MVASLLKIPVELRITLPDGSRFLGVHASPGRDDGDGLTAALGDRPLESLLDAAAADLICSGHTHRPMHRRLNRRAVVNLGAVSMSSTEGRRASYAMLDATTAGWDVELRKVAYDIPKVIAMLEATDHPGSGFIRRHLLG